MLTTTRICLSAELPLTGLVPMCVRRYTGLIQAFSTTTYCHHLPSKPKSEPPQQWSRSPAQPTPQKRGGLNVKWIPLRLWFLSENLLKNQFNTASPLLKTSSPAFISVLYNNWPLNSLKREKKARRDRIWNILHLGSTELSSINHFHKSLSFSRHRANMWCEETEGGRRFQVGGWQQHEHRFITVVSSIFFFLQVEFMFIYRYVKQWREVSSTNRDGRRERERDGNGANWI